MMIKKIMAWAVLAAAVASVLGLIVYVLTFPAGRILLGTITGCCLVVALVFWALDEVGL